jgi:hypothetical protein
MSFHGLLQRVTAWFQSVSKRVASYWVVIVLAQSCKPMTSDTSTRTTARRLRIVKARELLKSVRELRDAQASTDHITALGARV